MTVLNSIDRKLIAATQSGLPIVETPFAQVGLQIGISEQEVIARFELLMASGVVRRIAAAPNHYTLGMTANGMTVWDIPDEVITEIGREIGVLEFVTHCYQRPRALPHWPYNLFAMVHGANREEVETKRREIALLIGPACRASDILYSKRILKKTGLRLARKGG